MAITQEKIQTRRYFNFECGKCGDLRTYGIGDTKIKDALEPDLKTPLLLCGCDYHYHPHKFIGISNRAIKPSQRMREFLSDLSFGLVKIKVSA